MKSKLFSALKILFFFSIGVFLIWLVVRNLSAEQKQQVLAAFKEADYFWIILSVFLGVLSNLSRAMRWKMLLNPMGYSPKLSNTFSAVMIGYLANLAVPRLGEVSRCGVLTKYENIPFTQSFGTVITERIIDVLMLVILFFITVLIEYEKIYNYTLVKVIDPLKTKLFQGNTLLYLGILLVGGIIFFVWLSKKKANSSSVFAKLLVFAKGFLQGIKSIGNIKNPILFIAHSIFIWLMYYLMVYVCLFSLHETSSLTTSTALVLLIFGSVAVIVTPGGIGAYPIIIAEVLSVYNISLPIGYAFGWICWLSQAAQIIAVALVALMLLPIINKK